MRENTPASINLPKIIHAPCPVHGKSAFIRLDTVQLYACLAEQKAGSNCSSGMFLDSIGPDGGDVVDVSLSKDLWLPAVEEYDMLRLSWKESLGSSPGRA